MTSYAERYRRGEHTAVWGELRVLEEVPDALRDDVDAVATLTMRRVAAHVDRIAAALPALGFVPEGLPMRIPPTAEDAVELVGLDDEIGGLPAALAACVREVGWVSLLGDCPALGLRYHRGGAPPTMPPGAAYPDSLCLPSLEVLRDEWDEYREDDWRQPTFAFGLAPDELHKANVSGGEHTIELPDRRADPVIHGVAGREGVTLVEYLRESVRWGGFPGWAFATAAERPAALARLRAEPDC